MSHIDGTLATFRGIVPAAHGDVGSPVTSTVQGPINFTEAELTNKSGPLTSVVINGGYAIYDLGGIQLVTVGISITSLVSSGAGTVAFTIPDVLPANSVPTFGNVWLPNPHVPGVSAAADAGALSLVANGANPRSLDVSFVASKAETWGFSTQYYTLSTSTV